MLPCRHSCGRRGAPAGRCAAERPGSRTADQRRSNASSSSRRSRVRQYVNSDGKEHLGTALKSRNRTFPGPPPDKGAPLRILPIGGLGEIGMNCMLVGARGRYILVDAGLMFPDFTDYGMQKILPDTSFLAEWRSKIEAVIITHGHEDHIGALPWVVPALDPATPVWGGAFAMQLVKRRLKEFSLYDADRFKVFSMRQRFQAGPFEVEPIRVTHSIPDCCGLILRSEHGNIVHTGDWRMEDDPLDGVCFDRDAFEQVGREGVALMMSDSTNVLSPGRTMSETLVQRNLIERVLAHEGQGRVIATQFASNLVRLGAVKAAADAAGRKVAFLGMSLHVYLEAADATGFAPFTPAELVDDKDIGAMDPNKLLVVTTGSQGEDRAALNMASMQASKKLVLADSDLLLYTAKVIPGNDKQVTGMMNRISNLGVRVRQGRSEGLHTSGHAQVEELEELLKIVKPQHFLPVHGEASFLYAHAELARSLGCNRTTVIRNGEMLGVSPGRSGSHVSSGSAAVVGEAKLERLYNDGSKGTGTARDMALMQRHVLATQGIVVAAIEVQRGGVKAGVAHSTRLTARGMWTDEGRMLRYAHSWVSNELAKLEFDTPLAQIEKVAAKAIRGACRKYNGRSPEVLIVMHESMKAGGGGDNPRALGKRSPAGEAAPWQSRFASRGGRRKREVPAVEQAPQHVLDRVHERRGSPESDNGDLTYG